MTGDAKGALVAAVAYLVLVWLDRRPPSWWYGRPRPDQRPDERVRGELRRPDPPGRDLDRWQP
jgi:hypothetical protein